jgi:hypothetical protein
LHWSRRPSSIRPHGQAPSPSSSRPTLLRACSTTCFLARPRPLVGFAPRSPATLAGSDPPSAKAEATAPAPGSEFTAACWVDGVCAPASPYASGRSSPCPRRRLHVRRSRRRRTCPPSSIRSGGRAATARSSAEEERSSCARQPHHICVLDGSRELARRMASPPAPRWPLHPTSGRAAAPCPRPHRHLPSSPAPAGHSPACSTAAASSTIGFSTQAWTEADHNSGRAPMARQQQELPRHARAGVQRKPEGGEMGSGGEHLGGPRPARAERSAISSRQSQRWLLVLTPPCGVKN